MTNETALTISEQSQLSELEDIIDRGLQTFYEVGKALTIIRDEKLYRAGYATFEDYCEEKWQMSRAYAYRTIGAADVVKSLSPIGDIPLPQNEAQARPLTSLEPEQRQRAWTKAVEESGGKPTARQVQAAADAVSGAVYEPIHSLQNAVLAYHKRLCANKQDIITSLERLKEDQGSIAWGPLSLALGRDGKIFRNNDLRQAVNNALDSMRFMAGQPSEPAQETPSLADSVEGFILAYKDPQGRHWSQISNPSHTNGAFWQAIKRAFDRDGIAYKDEESLKFNIKWAFSRLSRAAEIAASEPDAAATEPEKPAKHWGLSNGMAFWTTVDKLGVTRAGIFEFLQPGAKYLTDLSMTKEEAFARLLDAPRRVDPYNPTQSVEPVAAAPVLNEEQTEPRKTYGPCAHCGRELTGPGWTSDLGGNVCDACASEHSRHAQMSQGQVFATLPDPPPSDMVMATNSLRVNIEAIPVNVRQELAQEFRWWSDDDKRQLIGLTGIKRDVCSARSILLVSIANLLDVN